MTKKALPSSLLIFFLVGCSNLTLPLEFVEYQNDYEIKSTFVEQKGDVYYRQKDINELAIEKIDGVNIKTNKYSFSSLAFPSS